MTSLSPAGRRRLRRTATSLALTLAPTAGVVVSLVAVQAAGIGVWGTFIAAMAVVRLWAQVVNFGCRDFLVRAFSADPAGLADRWQRNLAARAWLLLPGPLLFVAVGSSPARTVVMSAWLVAIVVAQSHDPLITYRRAFGFGLAVELLATGLTVVGVLVIGPSLTADHLIAISATAAVARAVILSLRFGVLAPAKVFRRPDLGELRASLPFFALTFSGAIQSRVDLYAVAALLPAAAVGEYALLTNFVLLVQSMAGALVAPQAPSLLRIGRGRVLLAAVRLLGLGVPLTVAGIGGTWIAMRILYDVTLETLPTAAAWLAMLPSYLYSPLVYLAFRDGRQRVVVAIALGATTVSLVGTLLLAPALGIGGAMLAAALAQLAIAAGHVAGAVRAGPRTP